MDASDSLLIWGTLAFLVIMPAFIGVWIWMKMKREKREES